MKITASTPSEDGFYMPGEFEPHDGCIMIWPKRPGSWNYGARKARQAFAQVAEAIADSEPVYMFSEPDVLENARAMLSDRILVIPMESDDAWARDVGPTFVVERKGAGPAADAALTAGAAPESRALGQSRAPGQNRRVRGIDWQFNAWGGTVDGLYAHWEKDDQVAGAVCEVLGYDIYDARPFVLEGGSIHSDGQGTVLVTEACLLSPGRNPGLSKEQIEEKLKTCLGAEKIIWLKRGIYNDETNEHVDNICAFTGPGEVVLAWTDDENDPQYELSAGCLKILKEETDAAGRHFKIHKLPIPKVPVCITKEDEKGYEFEPGEDRREPGERLAASYVNFYISNGGVVVPQFGDEHDRMAVELLSELFPARKIYPVFARDILLGGGNIHCITQQIPSGI